jgi:hypothetical protein
MRPSVSIRSQQAGQKGIWPAPGYNNPEENDSLLLLTIPGILFSYSKNPESRISGQCFVEASYTKKSRVSDSRKPTAPPFQHHSRGLLPFGHYENH